jgi:hypothetical protein
LIEHLVRYVSNNFAARAKLGGYGFRIVLPKDDLLEGEAEGEIAALDFYVSVALAEGYLAGATTREELLDQTLFEVRTRIPLAPSETAEKKVASAPEKKEEKREEPLDGFKIMTRVDLRGRENDRIASLVWELTGPQGERAVRTAIEKRKRYDKTSPFVEKYILVYQSPDDIAGMGLLAWSYKQKENALWTSFTEGGFIRPVQSSEMDQPFADSAFLFSHFGKSRYEEFPTSFSARTP